MTKLLLKDEAIELLSKVDESVAREHDQVCATIGEILDNIDEPMTASGMISLVLNDVDVEYLPIITSMIADALGPSVLGVMNPELMLFHRLFEYAYILGDEEIEENDDLIEGKKTYLHLVSKDLH